MRRFSTKIWLVIFASTFAFGHIWSQEQVSKFEISSQSPKDSVVYIIEQLITSESISDLDSIEKVNIYLTLDSLQLYNSSLQLIQQEIDKLPENLENELLHLSTQKAFSLMKIGQYQKAYQIFIGNIEISKRLNTRMLIHNYGGLATSFFNQSELDSCIMFADLFFKSAQEHNDTINMAEALKIKGNVFYTKADYTTALKFHKQALPYCDSLRLGSAYNEIGRDYFYLNRFDSAFYYLNRSLSIKKQIGDNYGYCASLGNLGQLYQYYGNQKLALEYFDKCSKLASDYGYTDLIAWMKKSKCVYYEKIGDYKKALLYCQSYALINESLLTEKNDIRFAVEKAKSNAATQRYFLNNLKKENKIEKLKSLRLTYLTIALSLIILVSILFIVIFRLRNQKRTLELKQQLGRAQMNPHFIFNALNLLQQNILKGDIKSSNKFLNKFSHLVRNALESSDNALVSIDEEIRFLENYLALEAMRFEQQFNYSIKIDDCIDLRHSKIPSMIIQPFAENAIWHGLLQQTSNNKNLSISFSNKEKYILCEIYDNGIGLTKSMELKEARKSTRRSLGIGITKKRLESLSKIYKAKFKLDIVDLNDSESKEGTLVQLQFPIIV